jgi:hypothetical protein
MNSYEEFGLTPGSTPEEINKAHRSLARILHPDNFQDPHLRMLAERQMMRVNAAFAELAVAEIPPPPPPPPPRNAPLFAVTAVAATLGVAWLWVPSTNKPPPGAPQALPQALDSSRAPLNRGAPPPSTRRLAPRRLPKVPTVERNPALSMPEVPASQIPELAATPRPETLLKEIREIISIAPVPSKKTLAGIWVYMQPAGGVPPNIAYPTEYAELMVRENAGSLTGRFRGRNRVADKALSPVVEFRFQGGGGEDRFAWSGNAGAKGEVTLKPLPGGRIQVDWFTRQAGSVASLTSGSEILWRTGEQ